MPDNKKQTKKDVFFSRDTSNQILLWKLRLGLPTMHSRPKESVTQVRTTIDAEKNNKGKTLTKEEKLQKQHSTTEPLSHH